MHRVNPYVVFRSAHISNLGHGHMNLLRLFTNWYSSLISNLHLYESSPVYIDEDYQLVKSRRRFICLCLRFEIWADCNRTYGLTLCIWELYLRFEIRTYQNKLYPRFEIWVDRNRWMIYDRCKPMSPTQCTSLPKVESPVSLYVS